jgi:hypothetical protein
MRTATMTGDEDTEFAGLDAHIRTQLAAAAETCALHVDLDARLTAIFEAGTHNGKDDADAPPV